MTSLLLLLLLAGDLDAAEKALEKGEHRQAIELLGDLADGEDPDVRALIVLGRAFLGLREYEGAVDPLLNASDARPDDKELARDAAWACWGAASGQFARAYLEDHLVDNALMEIRSMDLYGNYREWCEENGKRA